MMASNRCGGLAALAVLGAAALFSPTASAWSTHGASSSMYIHSNDTFTVTLSASRPNVLHGSPNSFHDLEFILKNNDRTRGYFLLSQESEDGFIGTLDKTSTSLAPGQQETIGVRGMRVPDRKSGMKVRYALVVRKEDGYRKKRDAEPEAPPNQGGGGFNNNNNNPGGGSFNNGGGSSGNWNNGGNQGGGFNNNNPGGGSAYNPGGNTGGGNWNGGGGNSGGNWNGGGGNTGGGSGNWNGGNNNVGGGSGNWNNGGGSGGNWNNPNDPSHKREVVATVEFMVTNRGLEDDSEPWTKIEYGADDDSQTCSYGPENPACANEWWWVKFFVQDEESGLHLISVTPTGKETYTEQVYFRHLNFPIGTFQEQEVVAAASCCIEGMRLTVQDVAGEMAEAYAVWDGTGTGLSRTAIYAIIGGCAAAVVLIIVIVVVVVCRNKYSSVSQNP